MRASANTIGIHVASKWSTLSLALNVRVSAEAFYISYKSFLLAALVDFGNAVFV